MLTSLLITPHSATRTFSLRAAHLTALELNYIRRVVAKLKNIHILRKKYPNATIFAFKLKTIILTAKKELSVPKICYFRDQKTHAGYYGELYWRRE